MPILIYNLNPERLCLWLRKVFCDSVRDTGNSAGSSMVVFSARKDVSDGPLLNQVPL